MTAPGVDSTLVLAAPALVACVLRNRPALDDAFADLYSDEVPRVVSYILARYTDFPDQWEWCFTNCASANQLALARGIPFAPPAPPAPTQRKPIGQRQDDERSQMMRMIFRLLRGGVGSKFLAAQSRSANAQLTKPMSDEDLSNLVVWCAKKHLTALASEGKKYAR